MAFGLQHAALVMLALLPLAVLAASLMIAVALFAKSFKEAQTYLTPLVMLSVIPMMAGIVPTQFTAALALIPLYNTSQSIKEILLGESTSRHSPHDACKYRVCLPRVRGGGADLQRRARAVPNVSAPEPIGVAGTGAYGAGARPPARGSRRARGGDRGPRRSAARPPLRSSSDTARRRSRFEQLASQAHRILIAVSDDAVAGSRAPAARCGGMRSGAALHTCGARGAGGTRAACEPRASPAACCIRSRPWPLRSRAVAALRGSWFADRGRGRSGGVGRNASARSSVASRCALRPDRMPLYHAAAVMASNYVTGLLDAAVILMKTAGIDERNRARRAWSAGAGERREHAGFRRAKALTGPIRRGDVETVRRHLVSLADAPPPARAALPVRGSAGARSGAPLRVSPSRRHARSKRCCGKKGSHMEARKRVRVPDLREKKSRGEKIAMLTAYDATMARLFDRAGIDVLLVGDSLGNVIMGCDTTLPVTLDVDGAPHARREPRREPRAGGRRHAVSHLPGHGVGGRAQRRTPVAGRRRGRGEARGRPADARDRRAAGRISAFP